MTRLSSRRDYLRQVVRTIQRELDFKVSSRFKDSVSPFAVEGIVIRVAAVPGKVELVAAVIDRSGVRTYDPFPASGVPHVELLIYDEEHEIIDHRVSCDVRDVVEAIRQWKRSHEPREPKKLRQAPHRVSIVSSQRRSETISRPAIATIRKPTKPVAVIITVLVAASDSQGDRTTRSPRIIEPPSSQV